MVHGVEPIAVAGGSIAFEVEDIAKLVEELKNKNVEFKMDMFESPVCHMAVVLDSEDNAFMLLQLKREN